MDTSVVTLIPQLTQKRESMASESFLAVPTVSNPQETEAVLSLNHMSLLTSVEAMSYGAENEEFNLDKTRVINDAICAPLSVNNEIPGINVVNTNSQALPQSTTSKKGRNVRNKNTKKTAQESSAIQLQPTQPSLAVLTPARHVVLPATTHGPNQYASGFHFTNQQFNTQPSLAVVTPAQDVVLPATTHGPNQHASGFHFTNQQLNNNIVPTIQAQSRMPPSPTPSCSSMTEMQLAEMMFLPKPTEDNGKHRAKSNYLNQCKTRLSKYQIEAMQDFANVLYMPFNNETSFESLEGVEMQFAFRKKVFDCMETLNRHSQAVWEFEKAIYSCVLPLREKVGGVLPDKHDFSSVTSTRINNALKRKRQEQLENWCGGAISVEVIEQLRPPKSYCLKQWPSRPAGEQFEKLQPLFEAFVLMRQDPDLCLHKYDWVQTLEQF
ncbi:hypothetical protein OS493_018062 [Desmophyllum pertusum]|uniref:Uncharacterized protein n=1 Tax=Desmophyllum pertusum TaxID=174260 RepID=A0A9W9YN75_9CNID|nr:hypothetical protein OS493_018062 [Desmophyllum pertusum]